MRVLKISWQSLITFYQHMLILTLMSIVTLLSSLLIIPAPFAWAGLWQVTRQISKDQVASWSDYWQGSKEYGLRNLGNILLLLFVYVLIAVNIWFYNQSALSPLPPKYSSWLTGFWLIIGLFWGSVAFYLLAFQMQMSAPSFWLSLRNSIYLTLLNPLPSLFWMLLLGLYGGLCYLLPPLVILYPALIAVLSQRATLALVQQAVTEYEQKEPTGI